MYIATHGLAIKEHFYPPLNLMYAYLTAMQAAIYVITVSF